MKPDYLKSRQQFSNPCYDSTPPYYSGREMLVKYAESFGGSLKGFIRHLKKCGRNPKLSPNGKIIRWTSSIFGY